MATTASTNVVSLQPTACNAVAERFVVISYNLHGYNQGRSGLVELVSTLKPDAIMVQEHWLTPDNLYKLNQISDVMSFLVHQQWQIVSGQVHFMADHLVVLPFLLIKDILQE